MRTIRNAPVATAPSHGNYVSVALAAALTGLSQKAIRRKIEQGRWLENREYRRAPDGAIFISLQGFQKWVERQEA
ncbi:excisionase [Caballeronia sp. J97]|uniref:excisionase n=1 Tax=Caballeronia sp. J97 TaxID=2805429 RepID=UPI002AAF70BC|nr:excisionase [Caballeronia sp. J97]